MSFMTNQWETGNIHDANESIRTRAISPISFTAPAPIATKKENGPRFSIKGRLTSISSAGGPTTLFLNGPNCGWSCEIGASSSNKATTHVDLHQGLTSRVFLSPGQKRSLQKDDKEYQ